MLQVANVAIEDISSNVKVDCTDPDRWFKRLLYVPAISYLVIMTIFPLLYSLGISFTSWSLAGSPKFVGFQNYRSVLVSYQFWMNLRTTVILTVVAVGIEIILGVLLALLLNRNFPGVDIFRTIIMIPMMLSPLVIGYFWKFMFDKEFGVIGWFLTLLRGHQVSWLTDPLLALVAIVVVDVWQWTPFVTLLAIASLQTINPEIYEAASLDRASMWTVFRKITLPFLRPGVLVAVLFRMIDTFKIFDLVYILTAGGPGDTTQTLCVLAYREGFRYFNMGRASAISYIIVVFINVLATLVLRSLKKSKELA